MINNAESCQLMLSNAEQCAEQCRAMPSNAEQCRAMPSNAEQCRATLSNTEQWRAMPSNAKQYRGKVYLFHMRQFEGSFFSQHSLMHFPITHGLQPLVIWGNASTCAEKKLNPRIASCGKDILYCSL